MCRKKVNLVFLIYVFLHSLHNPALGFETPTIALWPRQYRCLPAGLPPQIDGILDDHAWQDVPWTAPFVASVGPASREPRLRSRAKLMWDDDGFYVGIDLREPQVWATHGTDHRIDASDNSIALYIDPDGDNHRSIGLRFDAAGRRRLELLPLPHGQSPSATTPCELPNLRAAVHVAGSLNQAADRDSGWSVEIAIPWAALAPLAGRRNPPRAGDIWRVNFARVQWRTRGVGEHYQKITAEGSDQPLPAETWVWSPQGLSTMDHPELWGEVLFVTDPDLTFAEAPEHHDIGVANLVMPIYYLQKLWYQEHGRFAGSLSELGVPAGEFPLWPPPAGGSPTTPLPGPWHLELEGTDSRFEARLLTPDLAVTVDETGRLRRENRRSP